MICNNCNKFQFQYVTCQGCQQNFCRKDCWSDHWCGELTDRDGVLIKVGDTLNYSERDRAYIVTEIPGTFKQGGMCYGDRVGRRIPVQHHIIIRPRLMRIQKETDART